MKRPSWQSGQRHLTGYRAEPQPVPGAHPQAGEIRLALLGPGPAPKPAGEVPGPFGAWPFADGIQFLCRSCAKWSEVHRADGGMPEPGEEMTVACEQCDMANTVTVRAGMFG